MNVQPGIYDIGFNIRGISSIAVIGFGLTSYCIGAERGWVPRAEAEARVEATLKFLLDQTPAELKNDPLFNVRALLSYSFR